MRWPDCIPVREGASGARLDPFRPGVNLFSRPSQKAKLDLQKSIVTNSPTYLINCNFFLTVVQFIYFLFKLFLKLVPCNFYKQNLVVISKI